MREMLELIRTEYGGAEDYMMKYAKLQLDEVEAFRRIFVVRRSA